ncbi:TetR/AcrR family transcriptional regulator [Rugosimonospora acidiphila]
MAESDRRVRRTRRILREALVSLVLDKGYERITVQDVLDRADVGRSTFYAHFRDKEALLVSCFENLGEDLRREFDSMTPGGQIDVAGPAAALFAHAHQHRDVYRVLCGRQGGNLVYRHLHQLVGELLRERMRRHLAATDDELPLDIVVEFHTSATLGVLTWWINHDFESGPAGLARVYRRLAATGLTGALADRASPGRPDDDRRPEAAPAAARAESTR